MGTFLVNGLVFTPATANNSSFDNNFSVEKPNAEAKETQLAPLTSANGLVSSWPIRPLLIDVRLANSSCDQPLALRNALTRLPKFMFIFHSLSYKNVSQFTTYY